MANSWFVKQGGKDFGPYTDDQIRLLASQGKLTPTDQVFNAMSQRWTQANQIPGLFGFAPAPQYQSFPSPNPNIVAQSSVSYRPPAAKKSNTPLIAIGIIGTLVAVGIGAMFALRTPASPPAPKGDSSATAPSKEANPTTAAVTHVGSATTPTTTFRKELFDSAHRAAIEYRFGAEPKLKTELALIEPAIQSSGEKNVFAMLQKVLEIQNTLNQLPAAQELTRSTLKMHEDNISLETYTAVTKGVNLNMPEVRGLAEASANKLSLEIFQKFFGEMRATSTHGIVVRCDIIGQTNPPRWKGINAKLNYDMEKFLKNPVMSFAKPTEEQGFAWISFSGTKSTLEKMVSDSLKTVGESIHNQGMPRSR